MARKLCPARALCALAVAFVAIGRPATPAAGAKLAALVTNLIGRYASANGFDQLNAMLTPSFSSGGQRGGAEAQEREHAATFRAIEEFLARPESRRAKNAPLAEAADHFMELNAWRRNDWHSCEPEQLERVLRLLAHLAPDSSVQPLWSAASAATSASASARRKLLRTYQEIARKVARACLERYQDEWARALAQPNWLADEAEAGRQLEERLEVFEEATKELTCEHKFVSFKPALKTFECAAAKANESLASQEDAWDVYQTLKSAYKPAAATAERGGDGGDSAQFALEQTNEQSGLVETKPVEAIEGLLRAGLLEPCASFLGAEKRVSLRPLAGVQLLAQLLPLSDELFANYNQRSEQLIKWTTRAIICRRLLERTDVAELLASLAHWSQSSAARLNQQQQQL